MFTRHSSAAVTPEGVRVPIGARGPHDVHVGGHRVWSFDARRDTRLTPRGRVAPWPRRLAPYLDGHADVRVAAHAGATLLEGRVRLGEGDTEVRVVDDDGHPLSIDKGGRLQRTFDRTPAGMRELVVERTELVLRQLREEAGLEAFLAFGCLLGAVRDGHMIGHDCDADVAYLSRHEHPLDVIRENRAAALTMERLGHRLVRMSDADFKVWLPLPDGRRCGIDVFAGYLVQDRLHLLPSTRGPVTRDDLLPVGTVRLEGRDLVAPARPEALLAATYGPGWRTPDPAFHFEAPPDLVRHMDAYWRGGRRGTWHWTDLYTGPEADAVPTGPSDFARWVAERLPAGRALVELGSGTGRDAAWFLGRGHDVVLSDSAHRARVRSLRACRRAVRRADRRAERRGVEPPAHGDVDVRTVNLNDVRTTLREAARLAHDPAPHDVYARLVLDDLDRTAREELHRFADLVTRRGGTTWLEVLERGGVGPTVLRRELEARGGEVVEEATGTADGLVHLPWAAPDRTVPTRRWVLRHRHPARPDGKVRP